MTSERERPRTTEDDLKQLLSDATQRRERARRVLYETFAPYRVSEYGSSDGACPHCVTEERFQALREPAVAQLSREQIWEYCGAVWPGSSDFKYFLPRLLELGTSDGETSDWAELIRKLPPDGWAVCSDIELEAIAGYLAASHEQAKLERAADSAAYWPLFRPWTVPKRIGAGLPLSSAFDRNLAEYRDRLVRTQLDSWRQAGSLQALASLATGANAWLDDERTLTQLIHADLIVVPSDDAFFHWLIDGDAEAVLSEACEREQLPDELAVEFATVLANVARATIAR